MAKMITPDYMNDFSCIGGACEDTCCAGWKVTVDKKTYQKYRKVQTPNLKKMLYDVVKRDRKSTTDNNYAKIILKDDGICPMVDEEGLCTIHKELGESYLCNTCSTYPRMYADVSHTFEKSLTLSCPEAARIVLKRPEGIGFIEVEEEITALMNSSLSLTKYPYFWDLRIFIIQLIQDRQQTIENRLIVLGLFLQNIGGISEESYQEELPLIMQNYMNRLADERFIQSLDKLPSRPDFLLRLINSLLMPRVQTEKDDKYTQLVIKVAKGLNLGEVEEKKYKEGHKYYYVPFAEKHSYIFENYIVNYIFKNLMPYDKGSFLESYMMLIIHVMLIKAHIIGLALHEEEITVDSAVYCIQQIGRAIEHNNVFLNNIRESMVSAEFTTMGHMFSLIK